MSPIVALCHFCEVHGPAVIMVTQSQRAGESPDQTDCETNIQHIVGQERQSPAGCERCWSLKTNQHLIISKDQSNRQTFLTSQVVLQPEMELILRNAVVRAISCEVPYKRETPLLFSDPSVSTVAANNFFLKDWKARGFQRYYSIIVVTNERQHLISNLKSINSKVSQMIENMKKMSDDTYNLETCHSKSLDPPTFRKRSSIGGQRNLIEIVRDPTIYEKVHRKFVEILQTLENGLKEKVFSGQSMKSSVIFPKASMDSVLDIKSQLGLASFRILLHHILSGKTLQIRSNERQISRQVGDSLCMFLPNNLTRSQVYFANIILTGQDSVEDLPSLTSLTIRSEAGEVSYGLFSQLCKCNDNYRQLFSSCKYCKSMSESTIISKLCKKLTICDIPRTVQEMTLRTFGESILSQARVFSKLGSQQKNSFLRQNNFTAIDAEILIFFKMFS